MSVIALVAGIIACVSAMLCVALSISSLKQFSDAERCLVIRLRHKKPAGELRRIATMLRKDMDNYAKMEQKFEEARLIIERAAERLRERHRMQIRQALEQPSRAGRILYVKKIMAAAEKQRARKRVPHHA